MFPENDTANLGDTVDYFVIRSEEEGDFPVGVPVTAPGLPSPFGSVEIISQTAAPVLSDQETRLETPDGTVELVVSPGSLPAGLAGKAVEINLQSLNPATVPSPPPSVEFIRAVRIESRVEGVGLPVFYDNPVVLRFPLNAADLARGDPFRMTVFRFDPAALSWDPLPTTFSDSSSPPYLETKLNRFSHFAVGVLQSISPTATPAPTLSPTATPRPSPTPLPSPMAVVTVEPTPLPTPAPNDPAVKGGDLDPVA